MDIHPVNAGHVLVVPNEHATHLADLPPETGAQMFKIAQQIAAALRASAIPCQGVNLYLADGQAAGQDVMHVHLHVWPRFSQDGFGLRRSPANLGHPTRSELERTAEQIRAQL
jgi:histidine triad (HIT) family protein